MAWLWRLLLSCEKHYIVSLLLLLPMLITSWSRTRAHGTGPLLSHLPHCYQPCGAAAGTGGNRGLSSKGAATNRGEEPIGAAGGEAGERESGSGKGRWRCERSSLVCLHLGQLIFQRLFRRGCLLAGFEAQRRRRAMEYIPGLDASDNGDADAELTKHVLGLVARELAAVDTTVPHALLPVLPEAVAGTSVMPVSATGLRPFMAASLGEKYTSPESLDLPLLASYSQLRMARNAVLEQLLLGDRAGGTAEAHSFDNLLQLEAADLKAGKGELERTLSKKRRLLEETAERRKRQTADYRPVDEFLSNRWNEKVNELLQLQIEKLGANT